MGTALNASSVVENAGGRSHQGQSAKSVEEFAWSAKTNAWVWCERHLPGQPDTGAELYGFDADGTLGCITIELAGRKGALGRRWIRDLTPALQARLMDRREAVTRYFRGAGDRRRITFELDDGESWTENPCTGGWLAWGAHPAMGRHSPEITGVTRSLSIGVTPDGTGVGDNIGWEIQAIGPGPDAARALDEAACALAIPGRWRDVEVCGPFDHLKVAFARDGAVRYKAYAWSR